MSEIDLVKVVRLRYLDKQSRGEIAKELSKNRGEGKPLYHDANVNHWLADAEDRGVIAFDIDSSFATTGQTDSQLSRELRDALGLGETWVVKYGENDAKATDLHVALANQTGRRLTEVASNNTRFLVAGGRTVVQIARKINRTTRPSPASNIRIDPLSGRNWTGHWQVDGEDDLERPLDADDAAVLMAAQFPKAGTRFSQIGHPLYAEDPAKAKIIMRDHCAFLPNGEWNWNIHTRIDQAICGIGVLHPKSGHRIVRFLRVRESLRDLRTCR
jgi:DNA-binding transcriptional regulator LsrR (DeoR family)